MPPESAATFPPASPLHAFFAWNQGRRAPDRRYRIARDILAELQRLGDDAAGRQACADRLAGDGIAARRLVDSLADSRGSAEPARHAAVFAAFEEWQARPRPRRILVIKLGALGDFVQALGPVPAIRKGHPGSHITLLTTAPFAGFAEQTGLFDRVIVDRRPHWLDLAGWAALGRVLRQGRFDRVYDLQTSDRSSAYAWLLRPGHMPEWSGIAWRCSHPHANPARDRMHTIDRQAEQLLMAGIHPVPFGDWLPPLDAPLAREINRPFVLLIPGSSPRHKAKRWPADYYGRLALLLRAQGRLPIIVGVGGEADLAAAIRAFCPDAMDLVGRTDLAELAALARAADLTVGNDSGATHVAASGGNPVVVLFSRASQPELCAPRGERVRVLMRPDLADLPVETVAAAAEALLAPSLAALRP